MRQLRNFRHDKHCGKNDSTPQLPLQLEDMEGALSKYGSMSKDELIEQLLDKIKQQKAEGTFDKEGLNKFVEAASAMMTPAQTQRMRDIVALLD